MTNHQSIFLIFTSQKRHNMSRFQTTFLFLPLFLHLTTNTDPAVLAKRRLIQKEYELFKSDPMSQNLRDFIDKVKKERQTVGRKKREDSEKQLYVIENNKLIPVQKVNKRFDLTNEKLEFSAVSDKNDKADDSAGKSTSVPGFSSQNSDASFNADESVNAILANIGKITNDTKPQSELYLPKKEPTKSPSRVFIPPVVPLGDVSASNLMSSTLEVPNSATAAPESKNQEESEENIDKKTEEENKVLHKILSDVETLMASKGDEGKLEGAICKLDGTWISDAGGVRLEVCFKDNTTKKFRVTTSPKEPPSEEGFLCNGNWTIVGELPFCHSGVMVALALHRADKHIATFIGECRVCEGAESVTGTWLLGRSSRDCKDQKSSHKILSDIWRRDKVEMLQKEHLKEIEDGSKMKTNSTK